MKKDYSSRVIRLSSFILPPLSLLDVARLRTYPQHTPPLLPLLRSRPGGVHKASVVRSPKSDKLSKAFLPPSRSILSLPHSPAKCGMQVLDYGLQNMLLIARTVNPQSAIRNPQLVWRRGWDSNPRYGSPHTAFPVLPIQPLLHLSLKGMRDEG